MARDFDVTKAIDMFKKSLVSFLITPNMYIGLAPRVQTGGDYCRVGQGCNDDRNNYVDRGG